MKRGALLAAVLLLAVSGAGLVWAAMTRGDLARPADVPDLGVRNLDASAQAAQGQRFLAVVMKPGKPATGVILQSGRAAEGWKPYRATFDEHDPLLPALDGLAAAATAEYARDRHFDKQTLRALQLFGVAVVVATDGEKVLLPQASESDPDLGFAPEVPALRVRHTSPVFMLLAEGTPKDASDGVGFIRGMRYGDAQFTDDEYRMWGGAVSVDAGAGGEFFFPWSAGGARVAVDGQPAASRAARLPALIVKLPAGVHRVEVAYGEPQSGREVIVILATAGVVASLVMLWLGLRTHPDD